MDIFKGKATIVTGGASGIGRALCEELGRRGAKVVLADVDIEGANEVVSAIRDHGGRAEAAEVDVTRSEEVQDLVDRIAVEHGHLDYMFNNAGIGIAADARDLSLDQWRHVIAVNLLGVLYGTTAAYSVMTRQGFGHIVNMSSLGGLVGFPTAAPYSTAKHGVVGLSTSLRIEAAELGVKVSVACPGYVDTRFYDSATVLNADREKLFATMPFKLMPAERAARTVLRGVARNRAVIVFPFHARLIWRLHRLCPALLVSLGRKIVRDFRASRTEP
ncbi:MAG TPA: SDR family oxidoreductase [Candidatus Hydrogenedentes bacterium]|nr:SDR family oxidoreductase [Candidatus Hydrogenedentota bacterium]